MLKLTSEEELIKQMDFSLKFMDHKCPEVEITNSNLQDSFIKSLQGGYKGYEKYPTSSGCGRDEQNFKYNGSEKKVSWDPKIINDEQMRFRSGYQGPGSVNETSDLDLILKGASDHKIKNKNSKIFGNSNGANGYNGYQRNGLYYANYLSSDGVGNQK